LLSCSSGNDTPEDLGPKQLADSLTVEHKSLFELDAVHDIINWQEIEKTLSNLYSSKRGAPSCLVPQSYGWGLI
jgi:hypothetical protein